MSELLLEAFWRSEESCEVRVPLSVGDVQGVICQGLHLASQQLILWLHQQALVTRDYVQYCNDSSKGKLLCQTILCIYKMRGVSRWSVISLSTKWPGMYSRATISCNLMPICCNATLKPLLVDCQITCRGLLDQQRSESTVTHIHISSSLTSIDCSRVSMLVVLAPWRVMALLRPVNCCFVSHISTSSLQGTLGENTSWSCHGGPSYSIQSTAFGDS